jgi:hypothetical protein
MSSNTNADLAKSVLEAARIPSMIMGDVGRRYYGKATLAVVPKPRFCTDPASYL